MRSDLHDMDVIFQHRTPAAVCVRETEKSEDVWIPLSLVEIEPKTGDTLRRGCVATLTAPQNILKEKGLI